jgi:hypothetical protein
MIRSLLRLAALGVSAVAAAVTLAAPASATGPVEYVSQNGFTATLPYRATQCVSLPASRPNAPDQRFEFLFNSFPNAFYASYNFGSQTTEFWRPEVWLTPPTDGFTAQACATNTVPNVQDFPQGRVWIQVVIIYYATPGY